MPKTQEELNKLKTEYQTLNRNLAELTEDELEQVSGGAPKLIAPTLRLLCGINIDFIQKDNVSYIPLDSDEKLLK